VSNRAKRSQTKVLHGRYYCCKGARS
jgi:hypothetical protein